jgi:hypothetical protein
MTLSRAPGHPLGICLAFMAMRLRGPWGSLEFLLEIDDRVLDALQARSDSLAVPVASSLGPAAVRAIGGLSSPANQRCAAAWAESTLPIGVFGCPPRGVGKGLHLSLLLFRATCPGAGVSAWKLACPPHPLPQLRQLHRPHSLEHQLVQSEQSGQWVQGELRARH